MDKEDIKHKYAQENELAKKPTGTHYSEWLEQQLLESNERIDILKVKSDWQRETIEQLKADKTVLEAKINSEHVLTKKELEQLQADKRELIKVLNQALPMAEDSVITSSKNGSHQEFLKEDRELISLIKQLILKHK
jgi:hypothetical protein